MFSFVFLLSGLTYAAENATIAADTSRQLSWREWVGGNRPSWYNHLMNQVHSRWNNFASPAIAQSGSAIAVAGENETYASIDKEASADTSRQLSWREWVGGNRPSWYNHLMNQVHSRWNNYASPAIAQSGPVIAVAGENETYASVQKDAMEIPEAKEASVKSRNLRGTSPEGQCTKWARTSFGVNDLLPKGGVYCLKGRMVPNYGNICQDNFLTDVMYYQCVDGVTKPGGVLSTGCCPL
jgi:hypothetical protein